MSQPPPLGQRDTLAYATPDTTNLELRPVTTLARVALGFLIGMVLMSFAGVGIHLWDVAQTRAAQAGTLTEADYNQIVMALLAWSGLYLILLIGWLVSYMMWQYRAVSNVRVLTGDSRTGPGWSVGWWFIPFANLVMPYLILKDLWQRTSPPAVGLIGLFWLSWILSGVATRVLENLYENAAEASDFAALISYGHAQAGLSVIDAGIWLLFGWIIWQITQQQQTDIGG
jgi:hypothetical protein